MLRMVGDCFGVPPWTFRRPLQGLAAKKTAEKGVLGLENLDLELLWMLGVRARHEANTALVV